ncbi:MAG: hypothetical protein SWJ54_02840 [Cyanobacteriota bacterium]|nr:hypothetical protein [Cyanobacteriota bacterium]
MKKSKGKRYDQQLSPWCLLRLFPSRKPIIVSRFRSYNDAEGYLQTLQGLIPNVSYKIVFDPLLDQSLYG